MRPGNVRRCLRKSQIKGRLRIRQENIPEGVKTQAESGGHAVLAGYLGKSSYRYTPFGEIGLRRRRKRRGRVPVQWGSL